MPPEIAPRRASELGPSAKERLAEGKALRERVPRASHAQWKPPPSRPDPIQLLKHADRGRLAELLPIRYGRMRQSPFAFFRGSAALMAADLAATPSTRLRVQACGDCHVANFGGFGSPERRLVFDINDFDETLPAPWEWDVKRLAASIVLAGRETGPQRAALRGSGARGRALLPRAHAGIRRDARAGRLVFASRRGDFHRRSENAAPREGAGSKSRKTPRCRRPSTCSRKSPR